MRLLSLLAAFAFSAIAQGQTIANFGDQDKFFFGIASAPAHVEDQLEDSWLRHAREGKVAAFYNTYKPEDRNLFWTNPDADIDLIAETGVRVFRLGIDWHRLVPQRPENNDCAVEQPCYQTIQDVEALNKYVEILKKVKAKNMDVMLSLFHHSLPVWAVDDGGWTNPFVKEQFLRFTADVVKATTGLVDYWITFNEPATFANFSYGVGIWPTDRKGLNILDTRLVDKAVNLMMESHNESYDIIHKLDTKYANTRVGMAKNYPWDSGNELYWKTSCKVCS